jgi:hypothetical protein
MGNLPHVHWQGHIVRVAPVITPPIALLITDVDVYIHYCPCHRASILAAILDFL